MQAIRKTLAQWLRKMADALDPQGGGGGPIEPLGGGGGGPKEPL